MPEQTEHFVSHQHFLVAKKCCPHVEKQDYDDGSFLASLLDTLGYKGQGDPAYFDRLRSEPGLVQSVTAAPQSNVLEVIPSTQDETVRLAHLASFIPFSTATSSYRPHTINDGAAALLAVHVFNNLESNGLLDGLGLQNCNVKLTASLHDSNSSPLEVSQAVGRVLRPKINNSTTHTLQEPSPVAFLGSHRSEVTGPMALLTGLHHVPQISNAASSNTLDNKREYPLFGRTCPNTVAEAKAAVDYLQGLGQTHVGILYISE